MLFGPEKDFSGAEKTLRAWKKSIRAAKDFFGPVKVSPSRQRVFRPVKKSFPPRKDFFTGRLTL
jgi:hypothetical protein